MSIESQNICRLTDSYKFSHQNMILPGTQGTFSYFEARPGSEYDRIVFYGLAHIIKKYLMAPVADAQSQEKLIEEIAAHMDPALPPDKFLRYISAIGFIPLCIKAVPEGTVVPVGYPMMTFESTDTDLPGLPGFIDTLLTQVWYPCTVATVSWTIKQDLREHLRRTSSLSKDEQEYVLKYMLHDFGCRGAVNMEAAACGGSAHLLNFNGTDTFPALQFIRDYYGDPTVDAHSVAATEHSIMTSRGESGELAVVSHLLDKFNDGILSLVIDSYDYERFIRMCGTDFKTRILSRNGVTVFRPDSGDPLEVSQRCIELVGKYFGSTTNQHGYKVLNPKVRLLWGDGLDRQGINDILELNTRNGWAAENWVFGMGGALLQKMTRDTCRFTCKCSAQKYEYDDAWYPVNKRSADSFKESKGGRLVLLSDGNGGFITEQMTPFNAEKSLLQPVFANGHLYSGGKERFSTIKTRLNSSNPV